MKKKGFLFFAVYILVLVGIGVMAVTRAGETSRRKISIYKEATPEDGTGQGTETLQEVLHLTREAEILEVAELRRNRNITVCDWMITGCLMRSGSTGH